MNINQVHQQAELLAIQKVADRCKVDLYYLCKYVLGGEAVMDARVHGPLCRNLRPLLFYNRPGEVDKYEYPSDYGREDAEGMPTPEEIQLFWKWQEKFEPSVDAAHAVRDKLVPNITNLLALMPRGTLKSSIITIGFTIQWHLNFPNDRVLLDSETFTKSKAFLQEIKGHYESNAKLRKVFHALYGVMPDDRRRHDTWSTDAINLACRTWPRKEPSIDCAGIEVTKNGMHYDLALMDDLHSEKNTKTADQIEGVKDHYKLMFSLLDPGKPAVVIGTRWDYNDLYQMIIDDEQEDFNFITRKAIADDGELLYPKRLTLDFLEKQRRKQGSYIYSCQYLNNPVDDQTATFRRDYFQYVKWDDIKARPINWFALVDPSYGGPYSDYCAIVIAGMDSDGNIYIRHITRQKMTYAEIIDKMFELDSMFQIQRWGLEVVATQKSIEYTLQQEQIKRGKTLRCHLFRSRPRTKEERIRSLAPYYELKRVHHIIGCPNIDILEGELLRFPKSKNDDVSDALAGILEIGSKPRATLLDDKAIQKRKRYISILKKPRSPMVGY